MAEYPLLCLGNPLLGMCWTTHFYNFFYPAFCFQGEYNLKCWLRLLVNWLTVPLDTKNRYPGQRVCYLYPLT